jgi:galactose-1-phosphate uridylyltransferase
MRMQLTREHLAQLLDWEAIETLSFDQLVALFEREEGMANFIPDGTFQVDPRNNDRILFNSSRTRRPHDNRPGDKNFSHEDIERECVICSGKTTGIIDVTELSDGFTFINKNLFPIVYPSLYPDDYPSDDGGVESISAGRPAHGFHLLQWTSSYHDRDLQNIPVEDGMIVMRRLATLEAMLLNGYIDFHSQASTTIKAHTGYVSIFKNYGHLVGGSLIHGHQQIVFSNVMPARLYDNWRFQQTNGKPFSGYLLEENPTELQVKDYGVAKLVVPYFMRRPFDMFLLVNDIDKGYLHELDDDEIKAVTLGWQDAIRVILQVMPMIGKETAYNITTHNGPGAGLYFEFLPYTQEIGGLEHLGLVICQGNPYDSAQQIRDILER